jgi:hypothetical protein
MLLGLIVGLLLGALAGAAGCSLSRGGHCLNL